MASSARTPRPKRRALPLALSLALAAQSLAPGALAQQPAPLPRPADNRNALPALGDTASEDVSVGTERRVGDRIMRDIRRDPDYLDDPLLLEYLQRMWSGLVDAARARGEIPAELDERFAWELFLVRDRSVNAFALPGGYVYVTRGLLSHLGDEAELAGVLGHEVGHVTARHASQQYTRSAGGSIGVLLASIFIPGVAPFSDLASAGLGTLFLKYGRDDELESDRLGMEYAAKAGWDPSAVPRFLGTLSRLDALSTRGIPNWLSTHPDPGSRVVQAEPLAAKIADGPRERNTDEYLRRVDGLAYGDDPSEGVVQAHRFLHPDLRIALDFPEGWDVINSSEQVVAQLDGEKVLMVMRSADTGRNAALSEGAKRHMRGLGFTLEDGQLAPLNGVESFVGTYRGKAKGVGDVRVRAAHIPIGRQVYMVAGVAPAADFGRVDAEFTATMQSFRQLSSGEAAQVRPNRLTLYTTRAGDSWQSIAQRAGRGLVTATRLALMNGFAVNTQPPAGTRLKIVVEG